jgi:hypothetical protein
LQQVCTGFEEDCMVANSLADRFESGQKNSSLRGNPLEISLWAALSLFDPGELPILSLLKLK